MEAKITVTIDEEIIELFSSLLGEFKGRIDPGIEAFKFANRRMWYWVYGSSGHAVFRPGPKGSLQYDDKFTEWLKENRPEVFL